MKMKEYGRIFLAGALSLTGIFLAGGEVAWAMPSSTTSIFVSRGSWSPYNVTNTTTTNTDTSTKVNYPMSSTGTGNTRALSQVIYPDKPAIQSTDIESGYAGGTTVRGYAYVGNGRVGDIDPSTDNYVTVGAGTSGLQDGDPVTLQVQIGLDGITSSYVYGTNYNINDVGMPIDSDVSVMGNYHLYDTTNTIQAAGETDGLPTQLLSLQAMMENSAYLAYDSSQGEYGQGWDYNWSYELQNSESTNLGQIADQDGGENYYNFLSYNTIIANSGSAPQYSYNDTTFSKVWTQTVHTTVGAVLELQDDLSIESYATVGDAFAVGDFLHTFGTNITCTSDPGVNFTYGVASDDFTPTPEPSTLLLMIPGLAGLLAAKKRQVA